MLIAIGAIAGIFLYSVVHYLSLRYMPFFEGQIPFTSVNSRFKFLPIYILAIIVLSALVTQLSLYYTDNKLQNLAALIYAYTLIILALVDFRTHILPDTLTKPLILLGLVQSYFNVFTSFYESLAGAILGYVLFWGINTAFRKLRHKEGMGYGDFKLMAAIGAWCGIGLLPLVILLSSFMGIALTLLTALITKRSIHEATPFGPSLAAAGIISLYFGRDIITYYLSLFQ